ncbi:MAG: hypothetical protein AB7O37_10070 [Vicinamibacteria bacterium]
MLGSLVVGLVLLLLLAAQGRPLFYWGARAPVVAVPRTGEAAQAQVAEVHAAVDAGDLVLRFSFDRPVAGALELPDGTPVSGRLSAVLYVDADDDRGSGLAAGERDPRRGAERRLELGSIYIGEDPPEQPKAAVVVRATLESVASDGRRRTLWRADDQDVGRVSWRGEWVELRVPEGRVGIGARARLILDDGPQAWDGRFDPAAGASSGAQAR